MYLGKGIALQEQFPQYFDFIPSSTAIKKRTVRYKLAYRTPIENNSVCFSCILFSYIKYFHFNLMAIKSSIYLYTYKTLVVLLACLRPCVDSIIQGFSRPVMKVCNLDTITLINKFYYSRLVFF